MTDRSHLRFGPDPWALDDVTAERLLRGLDPADAPPAYEPVAELVAALQGAPRAGELVGEAGIVAAMAAEVVRANPPVSPRRSHMLKKIVSTRFAAMAAVGVLSMGGVAAAASGTLQTALASVTGDTTTTTVTDPSTTSTTVTDPSTTSTTVTDPSTTSTTVADTTSTTVADTTSTTVGSTTSTTVSATAPSAACTAATNHGEYVSGVAHDHSVTGRDHGQAVSEAAQSDCGKSGSSSDATDTPDTTGSTTSTTAPAVSQPVSPTSSTHGGSSGHGSSGHGDSGHGGGKND